VIASKFKSLAWRYQAKKWFRQALECHSIYELIHIEMEYLPVKLQHFNWIVPDGDDVSVLYEAYLLRKPPKKWTPHPSRTSSTESRGGLSDQLDHKHADPQDDTSQNDKEVPPEDELMSIWQFEMLISDCVFSGVQGRYLERVRREFGAKIKNQMVDGSIPVHPDRLYQHLHALVGRTVAHFRAQLPVGAIDVDIAELGKVLKPHMESSYIATRSHVIPSGLDPEDRPYPSTVLFFNRDKFGKWNLGVDDTNSFAAQQSFHVLNRLHKMKQIEIFNEFYYSK